jgi:hypothetical protein
MAEQKHADRILRFYNRFWYVPEILLVGFMLIPVNAMPIVDYVAGLHNDGAMVFAACMYLAMLTPAALICLLVLAVRMAISWPAHIQNRRKVWILRLLTVAGLVAFVQLPFRIIWSGTFMHGFTKYIEANADLPAIRAWLSGVNPNFCTGEIIWMDQPHEDERLPDWPQAVTSLKPLGMTLRLDRDKYPVIRLEWGGLDVVWGIEIGPQDMEIPKTLPRKKVQVGDSVIYEHGEQRIPVGPGAYMWRRLQ